MSLTGTPEAYLVMTMVRTGGALVLESETVCFDREFAMDLAREDCAGGEDCQMCAWSGVYPLDAEGRYITGAPIFWAGSLTAAPRSGCPVSCAPARQDRPATMA